VPRGRFTPHCADHADQGALLVLDRYTGFRSRAGWYGLDPVARLFTFGKVMTAAWPRGVSAGGPGDGPAGPGGRVSSGTLSGTSVAGRAGLATMRGAPGERRVDAAAARGGARCGAAQEGVHPGCTAASLFRFLTETSLDYAGPAAAGVPATRRLPRAGWPRVYPRPRVRGWFVSGGTTTTRRWRVADAARRRPGAASATDPADGVTVQPAALAPLLACPGRGRSGHAMLIGSRSLTVTIVPCCARRGENPQHVMYAAAWYTSVTPMADRVAKVLLAGHTTWCQPLERLGHREPLAIALGLE